MLATVFSKFILRRTPRSEVIGDGTPLPPLGKVSGIGAALTMMPMTEMEPSKARALWFALVDNAARLVVDADTLGPASPRAQSLVVLAMEELGKAHWVAKVFWRSWCSGDEAPLNVPYLDQFGSSHRQKLMQSTHYVEGAEEFVSGLRFFRGRAEVELRPAFGASDPRRYESPRV